MIFLSGLSLLQKGGITKEKQLEELARFRRHFFALNIRDIKFLFHQVALEDTGTWMDAKGLQVISAETCHH